MFHIALALCKETLNFAEYIIEIMSQMLQLKQKTALFSHVYLLGWLLLTT